MQRPDICITLLPPPRPPAASTPSPVHMQRPDVCMTLLAPLGGPSSFYPHTSAHAKARCLYDLIGPTWRAQQLLPPHQSTLLTFKLTSHKVQDKEKGPPLMVQKTDGGFGYDTTDMACIRHRLNDEKGEWLIYVTDMGQAPHFEAIFAGAHKAGFIKQLPSGRMPRLDHVGFGVVLGEDGKRIATRSGEVSTQTDSP